MEADRNPSSPSLLSKANTCPSPIEQSRPWEQPAVERNFVNDIPVYVGKGEDSPLWPLYNRKATEIHEKLIDAWDKNMDVLLVFSALFSAVVTAFLVLSITLLSPDKAQQAVDALTAISAQISALNAPGSSPLSSYQAPASFTPDASAVGINILWAISLTISLFTSVLAMLSKQWLHNYTAALSSAPAAQARQRCTRFEGFRSWNVQGIIESLPVLLHISVFIFLVGLLLFLWPSSTILTALMATIWIGGAAGYFFLALGPVVWTNCPYKSPLTSLLEFATSFRIMVARDTSTETSARTLSGLYKLAKSAWPSIVSIHPWLSIRSHNSIVRNESNIDSVLVGWLERNCTDQSEKEAILCACFGWKPEETTFRVRDNFPRVAAQAIDRLLNRDLGLADCLANQPTALDAEPLLMRMAIYSTYCRGHNLSRYSRLQRINLSTWPWADAAGIISTDLTDSLKTTSCLGTLLFIAGNLSWFYGADLSEGTQAEKAASLENLGGLYRTAVAEFCRVFETPTAEISLAGCWLLLEHLRSLGTRVPMRYSDTLTPVHQLLLPAIERLVATTKGLPDCIVASARDTWARLNWDFAPNDRDLYIDSLPAWQHRSSWIHLLEPGSITPSQRIAAISYIIHNSDDENDPDHETFPSLIAFQQIMNQLRSNGLFYPQHTGPLLNTEQLNLAHPVAVSMAQECLKAVMESDAWSHVEWRDMLDALQLFDFSSDIFRQIFAPNKSFPSSFRRSFHEQHGLLFDLIRCGRQYHDPKAAIISTVLALNANPFSLMFPWLMHAKWVTQDVLRSGWLDMLVEYAYVDVFQADVEKCEMMQLAILEFSHALVPHLGKLAQLVEDYPPVTKIAGFEECMRRAAEYTPQEEASLTPTTPYSWQQSNRHPGLLHCRGNRGRRAEPDVELGAAVDSGNMEPHNETKDTSVLDEKSEQARALQHDKTSQRGETSIQHWVARNEQVSRGDQVPRLPRPGAEREPTAVETTGAVRA